MSDVCNTQDPIAHWRADRGLVAETFPRNLATNSAVQISGTVYYMQIFLLKGQVITSSHITVGTAGVAVTFAKAGLYDSAGAILASSTDQTSAWATVGTHSQAFSSPYTVPTTGFYYVATMAIAGTTMPVIRANANAAAARIGISGAAPSGGLFFGSLVGQVDLPSSGAIAAGTAPCFVWVGLS